MGGLCGRAVWQGSVAGLYGRPVWQGCAGFILCPSSLADSVFDLEAGVQGSLCTEQGKGGSNHGRQVIENREGSQDVTV